MQDELAGGAQARVQAAVVAGNLEAAGGLRRAEIAHLLAQKDWEKAWNQLEDLSGFAQIHEDLEYAERFCASLPLYDARRDDELLAPAVAAGNAARSILIDGVRC